MVGLRGPGVEQIITMVITFVTMVIRIVTMVVRIVTMVVVLERGG